METVKFDAVLEKAKKAFWEGIYTGAITFVIDGEERPWAWVLGQLESCQDELPDHLGELFHCDEYAEAVRYWWSGMGFKAFFLPKLLSDPDLRPEVRARVQHDLDLVYQYTGWERSAVGNG